MPYLTGPGIRWLFLFFFCFFAPLQSWGAPGYYVFQSLYAQPSHPIHTELLLPWMKDVQSNTRRAVMFQLYMGSAIVPEDSVIQALLANKLDAALTMPSSYPKLFPAVLSFLPPHIAQDSHHANHYLWEVYKTQPEFAKEIDRIGKLLGIWGSDRNVLLSKTGPVRALENLKNKRVLVLNEMQFALVNAWGANAVIIHEADILPALEGNMGQMYYGPMPFNAAGTLGHLIKDITILPASTKLYFAVINWDQWSALPDSAKKYIDSSTGENWGTKAATILYQLTENELAAFAKLGTRIHTLDAEADRKFVEAETQAFLPEWIKLLKTLGAADPQKTIEKAYEISKKTAPQPVNPPAAAPTPAP